MTPPNENPATPSKSSLRLSTLRTVKQLKQLLDKTLIISKAASSSLLEALPDEGSTDYSSVVVEYSVPKNKGWSFRLWHRRLVQSAKASEGFVRADRYRPLKCKDGIVKWHSVIHFDRPEHLNQWQASAQREAALQTGQNIFDGYKFKSLSTGLEGWFSRQSGTELGSLGPPAWKQIASVVLGLYPVISLQERLFGYLGILEDWPSSVTLCINLIVTSCILTFAVMPTIVRLLDFWLQPAHQSASVRANVVGTVSTLLALIAMILLFTALP